MQQKRQVKR